MFKLAILRRMSRAFEGRRSAGAAPAVVSSGGTIGRSFVMHITILHSGRTTN